MTKLRANMVIAGLALIGGSTYLIGKQLLQEVGPFWLLALRFWLAFAALVLLRRGKFQQMTRRALEGGVILGAIVTMGIASIHLGLRESDSGQAAFIVNISMVLVPAISFFLLGERLSRWMLAGLVSALVGLGLLTLRHGFDPAPSDLWLILSAVCWSFHTVAVSHYAPRVRSLELAAVQMLVIAVLASVATVFFDSPTLSISAYGWLSLLYIVIVATVFRYTVQNHVQQFTSANSVGLLFALEPVFASLIGIVFAAEVLSPRELS
ncbi:MAG: DMT family transporter, partial [Bdellovibrionales bacterium]|nr:DMT family transporter [Bdellovibrionales bacterium]